MAFKKWSVGVLGKNARREVLPKWESILKVFIKKISSGVDTNSFRREPRLHGNGLRAADR